MPVERVKEFQTSLMDFLSTRKDKLLADIGKERALSDSLKAGLKAALDEFGQIWNGAAVKVSYAQSS